MVLQMAPKRAHLWGYGVPDALVTLTFDQISENTTVQESEIWELWLPAQEAGGPHILHFEHQELSGGPLTKVNVAGVLFGDVWLCLGEGNMEFFMGSLDNFEEEVNIASTYYGMRLFHVGRGEATEEVPEIGPNIEQQWTVLYEGVLEWYSAECLFFGQMLSNYFPARPIGLIEFAWTGTSLQSWMPKQVIEECQTREAENTHPSSGIHNAIMHPLSKFTVRGVLWDHGDSISGSDAMNRSEFHCATRGLFDHWRANFADSTAGDLPIGLVQLGPDSSVAVAEGMAPVRIFQMELADPLYPKTAMYKIFTAATFDLVDNISSTKDMFTKMFQAKRVVAHRLFTSAKEVVFSDENSTNLRMEISKADKAQIILEFSGDIKLNGSHGFAYATSLDDGNWTEAVVVGGEGRRVLLEPPPIEAKVVGYAIHTTPCLHLQCAVYDSNGLPLYPWVLPLPSSSPRTTMALDSHQFILLITTVYVIISNSAN
ncbi:sialate O-acetylesterase-like [Cloeon dipterum]|uniref:sialate O-acetylesterase-like n=1 Tax=Cloeon dipterum TaxID=197152 RepID=UPI0032203E9C